MITYLIYTFLFIIIVDGIKLFIESFSKYRKRDSSTNRAKVTAVVSCFNEETVVKDMLRGYSNSVGNLIILNDASTDDTIGSILSVLTNPVVVETSEAEVITKGTYNNCNITVIDSLKNHGKMWNIEYGLTFVETEFVIISDADIILGEGFCPPTELLETSEATAVAFNVMPTLETENPSLWQKMWLKLQTFEYAKSMHIGRKFADKVKSITCISGAIGLFHTKRLIEFTAQHSGIFPGEDLERTLIELLNDGKVVYSNQKILTYVPETFWQLTKQRVMGWWPGLWHKIPLFIKILTRRKTNTILRFEALYTLFALFTDVFKLISFWMIAIWNIHSVIIIYTVYLFFEILVAYRIRKQQPIEKTTVLLYPIYAMLQIHYRVAALFVWIWNRFIKQNWKAVSTAVVFLTMLVPAASSQDMVVGLQQSYIMDAPMERTFHHTEVYLGYKGTFVNAQYGAYQYLLVGQYYKNFLFMARFRDTDFYNETAFTVRAEHWFGQLVPFGSVTYTHDSRIDNSVLVSAGLQVWRDVNNVEIKSTYNFGYDVGSVTGSVRSGDGSALWLRVWKSINTRSDVSMGATVGYKFFYLNGSFHQNFDYETFDRTFIGAGLIFKF